MRGKPLALVAVMLVAAAGIFFLWRAIGSGPAAPELGPRVVEADRAGDASASSPTALEAADAADRPMRTKETFARTESFPLEGASWIAGRIVFPDGSPPDETLEVWAIEQEIAIGLGEEIGNAPSLVRAGEMKAGWWSRCPVEPGGGFRLPIPKGSTSTAVVVDGRYLYLANRVLLDARALTEPLVLEPALGAWLVGSCSLPPTAEPSDSPEGAPVSVGGSRATQIGADLAFEIRGLPAGEELELVARPARLMAAKETLKLVPGKRRDLDLALRFGGRARGKVVDEAGMGLAGVGLSFELETWGFELELFLPGTFENRSSADGTFELFGLRQAKGTIRAELVGFVDGRSEPLELREGETRQGITIVMSRGHRVAGKVAWPDGSPAAGAAVTARVTRSEREKPRNPFDFVTARDERGTETDERGEFSITGLEDGSIALFATALRAAGLEPGENPPKWYAVLKDVSPDSVGLVLVLAPSVGLEGRVLDDLDRPVKSFDVTASPTVEDNGSFASMTTTKVADSDDGSFLLAGLNEGRWTITVEAKGFVQTADPPVVEVPGLAQVLVLRVERTGSVAGIVLDPEGATVAGAEVSASRGSDGRFGTGEPMQSATTDGRGAFLLEDLRPGSASLVARKEDQASSDPISVLIEPELRLDGQVLRLRRGGRLTGEVYDSRGAPAAGRNVQVFGLAGNDQRNAMVDDAGMFAIENLTPGSYQLMLEPTEADQARIMSSVSQGGEVDVSEIFSSLKMTSAQIREGETTHVVIGAPPKAPVRLFGRVTRSGEPVTRGMVVCIGEGGPVLSRMKMAKVNPAGDYAVTLDEPGDYMLGYQGNAETGSGPDFSVTVPEAAEFRFDLELPTGGIRGLVRGPDGRGLEGVHVSWRRSGDAGSRLLTEGDSGKGTDGEGRFEFLDLAAGTYAVTAPSQGSFFGEEAPRWGRVVAGGLVVSKNEILSGVELRLSAPCKISGIVRNVDGSPLGEATVFARDERGQAVETLSTCRTDANGNFTCEGLAPGSYTLFARTEALATPESQPVVAREGETPRVELAAAPGTILIVSLEDREGHKLRGSISVRDTRGREVTGFQGIEGLQGLLSEGFDSSVQRVGPLPPGEYQVAATAADGRSARKPVELRGQEERSLKLRVD
ncbi:MAG: carboxypeptidase regulatory-like domain-containing protein [Planctomycetota bacterium]